MLKIGHGDDSYSNNKENVVNLSMLRDGRYYSKLSVYGQAMNNLNVIFSKCVPRVHLYAFSEEPSKQDTILSYGILKRWISPDRYSFEDIYPISFSELIRAVEYGIKDYKKEFRELSFLFDNSFDWNVEDAYDYINYYNRKTTDGDAVGVDAARKLAACVMRGDKPYWSIWRMSLKYVTASARSYLYKAYEDRGGKLDFNFQQRNTLTRWLYELARFPAGAISPDLLYKKIMLSQMFDRKNGVGHISSGMNEGVLYNLCFNLHASGLKTIYFGNYLDKSPRLYRSCHNAAAASRRYVNVSSSITTLIAKVGRKKEAYPLEIEGDRTIYYTVLTNYQIIVIGIDPLSVRGLDECDSMKLLNGLLLSCLQISGFSHNKKKKIRCSRGCDEYVSRFVDSDIHINDVGVDCDLDFGKPFGSVC